MKRFHFFILTMLLMSFTLLILSIGYISHLIPHWIWEGFLFFYLAFGLYLSYIFGVEGGNI